MADAEPRTFVVGEQDGLVHLTKVEMHRSFEADKSGKTTVRVWTEAVATPGTDDFVSIEGNIEFAFYNEDRRLGSSTVQDLKFTDKDDTAEIVADDGFRIETHEDVTHIEVRIESTRTTRSSAKLRLEPE